MAQAKIDIANETLRLLGISGLNSLDDGSAEAANIKAAWDASRDYCLSRHAWSFAQRRVELALDATVSGLPSERYFTIPADSLRTVCVMDTTGQPIARWERVGKHIVCALQRVVLQYTGREENVALWTPGFDAVMSTYLAFQIARVINASEQQPGLELQFAKRLDVARLDDTAHQPLNILTAAEGCAVISARFDDTPSAINEAPMNGPLSIVGGV